MLMSLRAGVQARRTIGGRAIGAIVGKFIATLTGILLSATSLTAVAEYKLNLEQPVTPLTRKVFDLHMATSLMALLIMVAVIAIVGFTIFKFRKSKGYKPDQNFHKGAFGVWSWILVPIIVLGIDMTIAGKATRTLQDVERKIDPDLTVKVTGSQWRWTYDYLDSGVKIVSNMLPKAEAGDKYLRSVDNPLVLPVDRQIRLLHTATDVLHAWWVPALAIKKDSIPGYINETWTNIEKEGVYTGQCAENCGTGHAYMPIQVKVVKGAEFDAWLAEKSAATKVELAAASSGKDMSLDDLMAKGEQVYNTYCLACHQANGAGIPPAFPALKGGAIATGAIADHLNIVIKGKQGTAMAAWGAQLTDLDIAAVITYERNAWGNDTGDVVQPSQAKAAR